MAKKLAEIYCREPDVDVIGKYGNEISIDSAIMMRNHVIQEHGDKVDSVRIEYNKRKDGVIVKWYSCDKPEFKWHLKKDWHDDNYYIDYMKKGEGIYKRYIISGDEIREEKIMKNNDDNSSISREKQTL